MAYGLTIQRRFDHNAQSVRNGQESVSGIKWNRRPDWSGMGVRNAPEYARYEYRFFVDGKWENDPACPLSSCVVNEFGSSNCVKIVE